MRDKRHFIALVDQSETCVDSFDGDYYDGYYTESEVWQLTHVPLFMGIALFCFAVVFIIFVFLPLPVPMPKYTMENVSVGTNEVLRFIALGDTGSGDMNQTAVAEGMRRVCHVHGCDCVILLGDNIYDKGPKSVDDPQWLSKFERPYAHLALPFFAVGGNHDNSLVMGGDGANMSRGDIQVQYSASNLTRKFVMPHRYYSFSLPQNGQQGEAPLVDFFALETNTMVWNQNDTVFDYVTFNKQQQKYFQKKTKDSKGLWKFAFGHHPIFANGRHGNAGMFQGQMKKPKKERNPYMSGQLFRDWFEKTFCGLLDVYFAGHDHSLQWVEGDTRCPNTAFIISGAGAKTTSLQYSTLNPALFQAGGLIGFWWVEVTRTRMTASVYTVDPNSGGVPVLNYTNTVLKP